MQTKEVESGLRTRQSFSKIEEVLEMPDLLAIQKDSYQWFLDKGLKEVFEDVKEITDYSGNLVLQFLDYEIEDKTKYSVEECKERDQTYMMPLKVRVRLINKEKNEVKEQKVFMADLHKMTDTGTFIVNGAERVIVSQLVRSPGAYFTLTRDKIGKKLFSSQIIPNRGAWLEYESDSNDILYVKIDRTRKLPLTALLRAFGLGTDQEIIDVFGEDHRLIETMKKDETTGPKDQKDGLLDIYKRLRPGEPLTVDSAKQLINSLFFEPRRYDLAKVGRYKYNKKLALANRLIGQKSYRDIINPETGELLIAEGETFDRDTAWKVQNAGINSVDIIVTEEGEEKPFRVIGNGFVNPQVVLPQIDWEKYGIKELVNSEALNELIADGLADMTEEELEKVIKKHKDDLVPKHLLKSDLFATISYFLGLEYEVGLTDDIDHLGNRRLRSVGELLQNQFRVGLSRMERVVRERMSTQDTEVLTPQSLINTRPINAALKEFFGSSQLSQFMDQNNPLSELTHKRRLSALGPGGLSRERAGFEVRDVHHSHYGRMCPIETPEGPNIGLIGALATYARINEYGFIESPYRKVENGKVTDQIDYLSADEEGQYAIAQANEALDEEGRFVNEHVTGRAGPTREFVTIDRDEVDYMDISPRQIVSIATSLIPFLENDDANRALMGANMQRQAVPLLTPEAPLVGTGMEAKAARDSGVCEIAGMDGVVEYVDANEIRIRGEDGSLETHELLKFKRSNQATCVNQRPLVKHGQKVTEGEIIADGPATELGELALGRNALIGFMTWEGFNYEDAVLINENLLKDDTYTSIHIEEHECEARETKLGPEEITRDIPNVGEDMLKNLDERGIIRIGSEVKSGDILVGKVTPKGETDLSAEEKLLRAIFGEKAREIRDNSLKVPHGESGIVVDVKEFSRENKDEDLKPGVKNMVRVYIATKRKISVGDKMAGRHGNKGVVSRILPQEDMPFLPDGTPLDICLNPLGVPSRMNIGQVLEVHLGMAVNELGWHIATPVFDPATEDDIETLLNQAGLPEDGKIQLYDGRTGEPFDNKVTVGYMYYLKLHHLVDDKMHARSSGPYSLVTQQPLGGKAQFGGQRFGEMEVWALEAYGASHTLEEIVTIKSDDTMGRVAAYEAIVKGENIPKPGMPESFKVLLKEFQSLGLDIEVLDQENNVSSIADSIDHDPMVEFANQISPEDDVLPTEAEYAEADNMSIIDAEDIDDSKSLA